MSKLQSKLSPDRKFTDQASWGYRWKMLGASCLGFAMDHMDMTVLGFVLPALIPAFGLSLTQGGIIATVTFIGAVCGGYVFGVMGDYVGRVKAFTYSILIFAVFTGLTAFAENFYHLCIFRFIAGIGIGGEFGIGMTLVTETWPKDIRATAASMVIVIGLLGAMLAGAVTWLVLPVYGWRGVFIVGTFPAILAAWSRYNLEEPEIWTKKHELKKCLVQKVINAEPLTEEEQAVYRESVKPPVAHLFKDRRTIMVTIGGIILTSVQNFGFFGIMVWLPTILMQKYKLTISTSTTWMIVTILGMMLGAAVFGHIADKIGRRPAFIVFQLASAASVWVYYNLSDPTYLLIGGAVMGFFCDGMMPGYGAMLAENYSTHARSTAENLIFNTGRGVGGFAPMIIGALAATYTLSGAMLILIFIYVAAAITTFFLIPETKGKVLH